MNIIFMGTPDFAVPCLKKLIERGEKIEAVFTQPDKPKGRGYKMIPTPVKKVAEEYDIPVYQPLSLRKGEDAESAVSLIRNINPDLIVVVAYGQILPEEILNIPKFGCVNVHGSLLPEYRGAAPMQWCLLNGEEKTGVTTMLMEKGLDTGDMLMKSEVLIGINDTFAELHDKLSVAGAQLLSETIDALSRGKLVPQKQDDEKATYSPMITKNMSLIDFNEDALKIHNKIRAITGYTFVNGKRLKVYRSELLDRKSTLEPGTVENSSEFSIVCGDGNIIRFTEVQPEGGKRLGISDYLRGNKPEEGTVLTSEI